MQEILLEPRHCRVPSLTRCLKLMNKQCTHDRAPVITVTAHMPSPHVSHLERGWCKSPNVTVRGPTNIKLSNCLILPVCLTKTSSFIWKGRTELRGEAEIPKPDTSSSRARSETPPPDAKRDVCALAMALEHQSWQLICPSAVQSPAPPGPHKHQNLRLRDLLLYKQVWTLTPKPADIPPPHCPALFSAGDKAQLLLRSSQWGLRHHQPLSI